MSDSVTFVNYYTLQIKTLVGVLEDLRLQNARIEADPTLISNYFTPPDPNKPSISQGGRRTDIVAGDVTDAKAALVQVLFAYDSGAPTQKSELFKVIP